MSSLLPPDDARLRGVVERLAATVDAADPLGAHLRGVVDAAGRLPPSGAEAREAERAALDRARRELEAGPEAGAAASEDGLDALCALVGVRRALAALEVPIPVGAVMVERHLLALMVELATDPAAGAEALATMSEAAPGFLARAREGCLGCPSPAAEVALAAAQRLPGLLDLAAAGVGAGRVPGALRARVEAALGALLMAAAEDAGWLVREVIPAAVPPGRALSPEAEVEAQGLGMSLAEVEAAAEAALAEAALEEAGAAEAAGAPEVATGAGGVLGDEGAEPFGEASRPRTPHSLGAALVGLEPGLVERAWTLAARRSRRFCAAPPAAVLIEPAPAWLRPLLPPLALSAPGPEADRPIRLLIGDAPPLAPAELDRLVAEVHLRDFLPAAWRREEPRLARLLLPASDLDEAWRLHLHDAPPPALADRRREVAWRALLALVGAGMLRGSMDVETAADLIRQESGLDAGVARAQAVHLAAAPVVALRWIAGMRLITAALDAPAVGDPAQARAALLCRGPLPGAAATWLRLQAAG